MNSKYATVGMRVTSTRYGPLSGTVQAIVPSPVHPRARLLRILIDGEYQCSDWHPDHWEPTALKERGHE